MRAIDGDALIDKYGDWYTEEGTEEGYIGTIKGIVDSMPTIEPKRKKGKWIMKYKGSAVTSYKCSECGRTVKDDTGYDVSKDYPFCHCGADMTEDSE